MKSCFTKLFSWIFFWITYTSNSATINEVNNYTELIRNEVAKANNYQVPLDASQYKPKNDFEKDFGTFDFIVVGAGSSGTVIANRLSEVKKWKILLIEAGKFWSKFTSITAMNGVNMKSNYNWGYNTIPQKTACLGMKDQVCPMPRGRGVGGTTFLNGLMYVRGNPKDFDLWAKMGNPGWSYLQLLPTFKKSEDYHRNDPEAPEAPAYHGHGGYLNVEYHLPRSEQLNAFLDANKELGYNLTDCNGPHQIGAGPNPFNTKNGRRLDGGSAFIKPILNRDNLKVMTESYVTKILIDKKTKTAQGVMFAYKGENYKVYAKHEVILSAGAIGSPQLLQLSGIGPKNHLKELKIPVIQNLEVGSTLRDHSQLYGLTFSSNSSAPDQDLKTSVRQFLKGVGPLAVTGFVQGMGFYQTKMEKEPNYPDLELILVAPEFTTWGLPRNNLNWKDETYNAIWGKNDPKTTFTIYVIALHCKSTGTVRLKSNNPYDYPLIDPNFISDPENHDIDTIYEGIKISTSLIKTKAFKKIQAKLNYNPLPACKNYKYLSKKYWYCAMRQLTYDVYHPVGTCPMGPKSNKGAVVDAKLKVHGIRKLRVADASVFPFTLSGHPNAPCVMIGEKVSTFLKSQYLSRYSKL